MLLTDWSCSIRPRRLKSQEVRSQVNQSFAETTRLVNEGIEGQIDLNDRILPIRGRCAC
jgi:hypothetical protein